MLNWERLKETAESSRRKADKAAGRVEQLMNELQKIYAVSTTEEAEEKLQELSEKVAKANQEFEEAQEAFVAKWGSKLGVEKDG